MVKIRSRSLQNFSHVQHYLPGLHRDIPLGYGSRFRYNGNLSGRKQHSVCDNAL